MNKLMLNLIIIGALILGISSVSFADGCGPHEDCYSWYDGTCDGFNSNCGCSSAPLGGDCNSQTKTWSAGTPMSCRYIHGDDGQDCVQTDNVNCYWSQSCVAGGFHPSELCISGSCTAFQLYFCWNCVSTGAATPHWYTSYTCE